ncbi:hypothetical protein KS4_30930 [Poriferisphaera corsica]|uniref:Uncharacterized protein n=1 Tax=Poriferisphaera corsica TaxID=2528020 RepID=A0A517YXR9_9BACT|nr:hypothetical protein KS4_30930 [Poriferisphaera corsica]
MWDCGLMMQAKKGREEVVLQAIEGYLKTPHDRRSWAWWRELGV